MVQPQPAARGYISHNCNCLLASGVIKFSMQCRLQFPVRLTLSKTRGSNPGQNFSMSEKDDLFLFLYGLWGHDLSVYEMIRQAKHSSNKNSNKNKHTSCENRTRIPLAGTTNITTELLKYICCSSTQKISIVVGMQDGFESVRIHPDS